MILIIIKITITVIYLIDGAAAWLGVESWYSSVRGWSPVSKESDVSSKL